jgi:hypothetical protein
MNEMSETKQLKLIIEAIRYCKRVKRMGMPSSCYSKALREPVYFLWTCRTKGISKYERAGYHSKAASRLQRGNGQLALDHAFPFRRLLDKLLNLEKPTPDAVRKILLKHELQVLVTTAEHHRLHALDRQSEMSGGTDPLARYKAAGIKLVKNQSARANSTTLRM